jgi:DNA-binding LacI/PurR family transcriptional regulator
MITRCRARRGQRRGDIAYDPALVVEPRGYDILNCQDAMSELLARGVVPTAVFGANDWAARGAIQAIQAPGRLYAAKAQGRNQVVACPDPA